MRFRLLVGLAVVAVGAVVTVGSIALAGGRGGDESFSVPLVGYEEVSSKSTVAQGRLRLRIDGDQLRYTLTYSNLETPALFSHIHFGQRHTNGGISAFLCGGGDKPACPPTSGTVSDVIDPADVIGPSDQGIEAASFSELVAAIRAGATYANLHSQRFPSGEIRGQIGDEGHEHDGHQGHGSDD
jgi:hypothetical protein